MYPRGSDHSPDPFFYFSDTSRKLQARVFWVWQGVMRLTIFRALMTSACLVSTIFMLTGCGHVINRLI